MPSAAAAGIVLGGVQVHREAGAILGLHRRLYPRPRPSPGRDRHAAPFPAHPAFRAPDGPHAGAPRPYPPPARRRAQHRGAPRPPRLARSPSPPTSQIHCAEELVRDVLEGGDRGFLLKSDARRFLISAVEALAAHKPFFIGKVSERLLENFLSQGPRPCEGALTPREKSVVQLV